MTTLEPLKVMSYADAIARLRIIEGHEGNDLSDNDKLALSIAREALQTLGEVRVHAEDIDAEELSLGFRVFVTELQDILDGEP